MGKKPKINILFRSREGGGGLGSGTETLVCLPLLWYGDLVGPRPQSPLQENRDFLNFFFLLFDTFFHLHLLSIL